MAHIVLIGAGIVGLATAYQILKANPRLQITVLEKESGPAMHQTGRNSGVVHSGIYYKPGSLKAKNCIAGRRKLLEFCDEFQIPYRRVHKLIVATQSKERAQLHEIWMRGQANGIPAIEKIGKERIREIEPHVEAIEAIHIPHCQIIDYKEVAKSLCFWIEREGGRVVFNEKVTEILEEGSGYRIVTEKSSYRCDFFVNCAGLHSDRIARSLLGKEKISQKILPFRGEYYELVPEKASMIRGLIYPVPDPQFPFLGVHLTRMINGKVEAGPNAVLAFAREGYRWRDLLWKDLGETFFYRGFWNMACQYWKAGIYEMARSLSKTLFVKDLQRLVPAIEEKDLLPGGAGVRAQVVTKEGKLLDDFSLMRERNALHVLNAPSPAATASFAIGRTLAEMILQD